MKNDIRSYSRKLQDLLLLGNCIGTLEGIGVLENYGVLTMITLLKRIREIRVDVEEGRGILLNAIKEKKILVCGS